MNLARPVKATKLHQVHAAKRLHKPGLPFNGPNLVVQRTESTKKAARKTASARSAIKKA
jgi:hypothetical protein